MGVLAIVLLLAVLPTEATAAIVRYAVIIGNDQGAADEPTLRYAHSDAARVYDVLRTLGDFSEENMVLLQGRDPEAVQRVLIATNDRIRRIRSTDDAVLFVFYSGHADADALHLGSERLPIERIRQLVRGSSADLRLLVLDSCRSGALTRVKGGKRVQPLSIQLDERLAGEGVVFLTSSSADEDAQESNELKGSFFTHYLVSGMVGPADTDRDGNVTLAEAYRYAYDNTIRASSKTLIGTHHPTFEYDMKGQGDVILTRVRSVAKGRARLSFPQGRAYLVFVGDPDGAVVAEVGAMDRTRDINVAAGRYYVRGRARDHLLEGPVRATAGDRVVVEDDTLTRVEYARLVRKGSADKVLSHGPHVGYQLRSPVGPGTGLCHGARLGYPVETRWLSVTPRVGWCRASFAADRVGVTTDEFDLDLSAAHVFDIPLVSIGLGVAGGVSYFRQTFVSDGLAPPRNTIAGHLGALLSLGWDLRRGWYVLTDVVGQVYVIRTQREDGSPSQGASFTVRPFVGLGKRF